MNDCEPMIATPRAILARQWFDGAPAQRARRDHAHDDSEKRKRKRAPFIKFASGARARRRVRLPSETLEVVDHIFHSKTTLSIQISHLNLKVIYDDLSMALIQRSPLEYLFTTVSLLWALM